MLGFGAGSAMLQDGLGLLERSPTGLPLGTASSWNLALVLICSFWVGCVADWISGSNSSVTCLSLIVCFFCSFWVNFRTSGWGRCTSLEGIPKAKACPLHCSSE